MPKLVIVESPTKARTIRGFLPAGYEVQASMGHVRDLPESASDIPEEVKGEEWSRLGVNVHANFEPLYVIPKDKRKVVKQLKEALKKADELILATDEDREGESISWHLQQVLQPKVPTRRMVFHEITREAIQEALQNCREVDEQLVRAQETRRILDRLVGYTLSPLLWKKIAPKLSAGRVQSVAVKLLVDRERERRAFKKATYWDLKADLQPRTASQAASFPAELVSLGGKRLASGQDFDPSTGQLIAGRDVVLLDQAQAEALRDRLLGKAWVVSSVEERPSTRKPAPPFTTSTLQQEANRKLRLSAQQTMRIAQKLYEEGYITYMRTDSVHLSEQAIRAARACVESMYGKEYLSPEPRQYTTKTKGAQEAHEAIRPAGSEFRLPSQTPLTGQELALYDLIWKRTVASQMAEARQTHTIVLIAVDDAVFRASGKRIDFPGFFRAYVEGSDDPEAALEDREVHLPLLRQGDPLSCLQLEPVGHETQPPPRYTEASLVKVLESEGIGRPSTYATILNTIMSRGYVRSMGNALVPTYTAFAVTELLEKYFPNLVNTRFTAEMEQTLDDIASGQADWLPYLRHFFLGEQGLEGQVKARELEIDSGLARSIYLENLPVKIGIGPYGPYVSVETESGEVRANLPEDIPPADLSAEHIEELIRRKQEGPKPIAFHPETQEPVYVIPQGPYGPYVQLGEVSEENKKPKRTSLPKGLKPEQVTPEIALGLLSLPRTLGEHPESGKKVQAGIGRFGPYVVCDGDFRSLPADEDVLTISLERALELLAQPKKGRGRGSAKPLRELGSHPEDGEPVTLHDGPYGLYVKHGKVNASLPKDLSPEAVTLEMALELLGSSAKGKGRSTGKAQAKASTTARKAEGAVPSAGSQKERTSQSRPSSNGTAKASHVQETAQTGSRPTILEVTPKARA
ncbi:DNA topoisomerase I [Synechococcus sp. 63AY4M2]|uniref:type I DNA topoisomerase n=1 Tax=unclassified Synechococcus TaxID=2626047 RepID=UPI000C17789C|nr:MULTISPECIES: type I DNA topoisomerase [unclassified Synechococcus]PIK85768.1 DNA topoisomerase I [Synechococcus sp. 63AY4M2]PIK94829.1 DNA topoisomerase I [Synechococcus sp. 60AY4M2]PIL02206.1 DNA topoisomerase I [Synechococcus sp. 65AY640]